MKTADFKSKLRIKRWLFRLVCLFALSRTIGCGTASSPEVDTTDTNHNTENTNKVYEPCSDEQMKGSPFAGGTGSTEDPFQLCTIEQLKNVYALDKNFVLLADLDFATYSGPEFMVGESYGTSTEVPGVFDGNSHSVSNFRFESHEPGKHIGFFQSSRGGTIRNLELRNIFVKASGAGGRAAGLIANLQNGSSIVNCKVSGRIEGPEIIGGLVALMSGKADGSPARIERSSVSAEVISLGEIAGGLVALTNNVVILDSSFTGTVSGTKYVGGLAGQFLGKRIQKSFSTGVVRGTDMVGGLVGLFNEMFTSPADFDVVISESHSYGSVEGTNRVGGIIGEFSGGRIENSYSRAIINVATKGGGLVGSAVSLSGQPPTKIINSYFAGQIYGAASASARIGGITGENFSGEITDSFSTGQLANLSGALYVGAIIGRLNGGTVTSTFFDISRTGYGSCVGYTQSTPASTVACTGVNSSNNQPNYFFSPTSVPLSAWDFTAIWKTVLNDFPTLR